MTRFMLNERESLEGKHPATCVISLIEAVNGTPFMHTFALENFHNYIIFHKNSQL